MISPKQGVAEHKRDWYPYYAGYTENFVASVLSEYLPSARRVLDPWSGSGTTTAACWKRGVTSVGVDINPALTVIAKARLLNAKDRDDLRSQMEKIIACASRGNIELCNADPLSIWFRPPAVQSIRSLERAIRKITAAASTEFSCERPMSVDLFGSSACFHYCALFATVRDILRRFRASNPTWILYPTSSRHRIAPHLSTVQELYRRSTEFFLSRLTSNIEDVEIDLTTASAGHLPYADASFDGVISSPPYATRIDYVKYTLPELAVLHATNNDIETLRRQSLGTPVVRSMGKIARSVMSEHARQVLDCVGSHPSKGSARYYRPCLSNYFFGLQSGISECVRTVGSGGLLCLVVQDSYYKEVHVDLQTIVVEMAGHFGAQLQDQRHFEVAALRSRMNPRAHKHLRDRRNVESLLVLKVSSTTQQ